MFSNLYNLNTTEARWKAARGLLQEGVAITNISAGFGWDLFHLGYECTQKAIDKIQHFEGDNYQKSQVFYDRIISIAPRIYEDEWLSPYVIKPYRVGMKILHLKHHTHPGQNLPAKRTLAYSVLGVPCEVAIYQIDSSSTAWCFR